MLREQWHSFSFEKTAKILKTDLEKGLDFEEVLKRRKEIGLNKLPEEEPLSKKEIFFDQFKSPLMYILIIAGLGTAIFKLYTDSLVIFGAVILNTFVGYFQEKKASQALRELKKIIKLEARVIRQGKEIKIDAQEIVPGDIVVLFAGDKVPADGRLIESFDLKINESPLTGEWLPAKKITKAIKKETLLADRDNMIYMGCIVENGKAKAIITETGQNSQLGRVALLLKEAKEEKTPLQEKISAFSKLIGVIISLLCLYIFVGGLWQGQAPLEMFTVAVAVAVAAIPEGLPIAMTVILALGMTRILKRKGLVRKLIAAETLGSTSVIATDKTLTLTEGRMEVSEIIVNNEREKKLALTIAVLCSEAFIENPQSLYPLWRIQGRPTDKSFVLAGARFGLEKPKLEEEFIEINEIPFNSKDKFIASFRKNKKGQIFLYVCGAPEKIISFSKLSDKKRQILVKKFEELTKEGLRVVATAYKEIKGRQKKVKDLNFVGFLGIKDPIRKEVKGAMAICMQAGLKPIIVTGDHKLTAQAVAKEIGLKFNPENVIEGGELDKLSDEELKGKVKDIQVFARVEPKHKLRIIQAWQERGEVVAMTGDGINDAPALKKADIGVALGSSTDVAKEVSDLVLLTDNFNIIVAAIEEGRAIIDNIRKVITYLLSDSFSETIIIGASILFGLPLPVTAVQILWINLIEDGLPSMALAFEPKEKNLMLQKPQDRDLPLLNKEMKVLIFIIGIITDVFILGLFLWLINYSNYQLVHIQSIIFTALGLDSLFYVFSCKSLRKNIWHDNLFSNKFLILAFSLGLTALLAALYLPSFQMFLGTSALNFFDWQVVLSLALANVILIEATKWYFISRKQTR